MLGRVWGLFRDGLGEVFGEGNTCKQLVTPTPFYSAGLIGYQDEKDESS